MSDPSENARGGATAPFTGEGNRGIGPSPPRRNRFRGRASFQSGFGIMLQEHRCDGELIYLQYIFMSSTCFSEICTTIDTKGNLVSGPKSNRIKAETLISGGIFDLRPDRDEEVNVPELSH